MWKTIRCRDVEGIRASINKKNQFPDFNPPRLFYYFFYYEPGKVQIFLQILGPYKIKLI